MFKDRAIQVKVVKNGTDQNAECAKVDSDAIVKIAKELITHASIAVGAVIVLKTVCKIAEIVVQADHK